MTERRASFADLLNPEQMRQYMAEAGYTQPQVSPLPTPMDVPAQPPAQLVEFRGTIEFQAHWELPAIANRGRDDLIGDLMAALAGQEAPWLPHLRYRVAQLTRVDPTARPLSQPQVDPRPLWRSPDGSMWRINPDGSLSPGPESPPQAAPNGWQATPENIPPQARREIHVAMSEMQREEHAVEGRLDGLEQLAISLAAQLDAMDAERTRRRDARKQRRVHRGDVSTNGDGAAPLPDSAVQEAGRDPRDGGRAAGAAPHDRHPGDNDGGGSDDRSVSNGEVPPAPAESDRDARRAPRSRRQSSDAILAARAPRSVDEEQR